MRHFIISLSLFAFGLTCTGFAEEEIKDNFSGETLSGSWSAAKGDWKVVDGMLSGAELKSDNHAAVLTYGANHRDSKGHLKFQLNGSKGFHLSFNHPKGHLFRVIVTQTGASLRIDKDKKDPASKPITLTTAEGKFEQGKLYTMGFEVKGDSAAFEFDNGVRVEGSHELLKKEKTGFRFIVQGEGVLFDDFSANCKK